MLSSVKTGSFTLSGIRIAGKEGGSVLRGCVRDEGATFGHPRRPIRRNEKPYVFPLFFVFLSLFHFFSETGQQTKTEIGGSTTLTKKKLRQNFCEIY